MKFIFIVFVSLFFFSCGNDSSSNLSEAPNNLNRPEILGVNFKQLNLVKTEARLTRTPWSGHYWAAYQGGISYRWQQGNRGTDYRNYLYNILNDYSVANLSDQQINYLSPIEKYDILYGTGDFYYTHWERNKNLSLVNRYGQIPVWYGICDGWASAATMEPEPKRPVTFRSRYYNRNVTFYPSDIKALLSSQYVNNQGGYYFVGGRCESNEVIRDQYGRVVNSNCRDLNPATLHLILDEYIGNRNEGFIIDIHASQEVWNQPVIGYKFSYSNHRYLSAERSYRFPANGTVTLIDVHVELEYLGETSPSYGPVQPRRENMSLDYTLELNSQNYIIGGEWISDQHPDFLWKVARKPNRSGQNGIPYQNIKWILDQSL